MTAALHIGPRSTCHVKSAGNRTFVVGALPGSQATSSISRPHLACGTWCTIVHQLMIPKSPSYATKYAGYLYCTVQTIPLQIQPAILSTSCLSSQSRQFQHSQRWLNRSPTQPRPGQPPNRPEEYDLSCPRRPRKESSATASC